MSLVNFVNRNELVVREGEGESGGRGRGGMEGRCILSGKARIKTARKRKRKRKKSTKPSKRKRKRKTKTKGGANLSMTKELLRDTFEIERFESIHLVSAFHLR